MIQSILTLNMIIKILILGYKYSILICLHKFCGTLLKTCKNQNVRIGLSQQPQPEQAQGSDLQRSRYKRAGLSQRPLQNRQ